MYYTLQGTLSFMTKTAAKTMLFTQKVPASLVCAPEAPYCLAVCSDPALLQDISVFQHTKELWF